MKDQVSGEEELLKNVPDFNRDGDNFYFTEGELLVLLAQSNQQAVQKALEGLLEQRKPVRYRQDNPRFAHLGNIEAVPVKAIEAELAAAQSRKDGDEST